MRITVKYSVPSMHGYSAQTKVLEGDYAWYLEEGFLYIQDRNSQIEYLFSRDLTPMVEIIPDTEL